MNAKRSITCCILFLLQWSAYGQVYTYRTPGDSTQNFYVIRPPQGSIKGAIVLLNIGLSDNAKKLAHKKGILLMTAVPKDNNLDFLMNDAILPRLDSMIHEAMLQYRIPAQRIIIGGMSAAGTAAIRYAEYCAQHKSNFGIIPMAVFAADPPLDYERLYNESKNAVARNYNPDAVEEGNQLIALFHDQLKGNPQDNRAAYQRVSPYSYTMKDGGNAVWLRDLPVRMYAEPDINWWIDNRRKDYYDLNIVDIAACINQLYLLGNNNAELITTHNKGYRKDGSRHPHAWSIVDDVELLDWSLRLFSAP